ncbi:MAG: glycosyltransferase [Candidatus Nanopelagicales bacterium]
MTGLPRWVLLTPDYPDVGGGIARLLENIVENSSDLVEWRVATTSPGPAMPHIRRAANRAQLLTGLWDDIAWAKESSEPRLICGHAYLSGPALAAAKAAPIPLAALVYGREILPIRPQHSILLRPLAAYSRVVSISDATTVRLPGIGVKAAAVRTVHPDIASPNLLPASPARDDQSGLRIVMLSRLSERYKNVDVVLAALSLLRETNVVSRCLIVGGGDARARYQAEVERLGLQDRVELTGPLPDAEVTQIFHSCDVGVFPSRDSTAELGFEGFGLVVHEMAAAALPVLVGDAAGAREAARPGWSLTLDPSDAYAWASALKALHDDPASLEQMTQAARGWAADLDPKRAVTATVEALRS